MQIVFGLLFLLFFSACCLCVAACTRFDAALLPLPALCGSAVVLYLPVSYTHLTLPTICSV